MASIQTVGAVVNDFADFFTSKNRAKWSNPETWAVLNPNLTITLDDDDDDDDDVEKGEEEEKKSDINNCDKLSSSSLVKSSPSSSDCIEHTESKSICSNQEDVDIYRRTGLIEDGCALADELYPLDDDATTDDDNDDNDDKSDSTKPPPTTSNRERRQKRRRVAREESTLISLIQPLALAITKLHTAHSLPATFILLYDEAWTLAQIAQRNLARSIHEDNVFNFDLLAWYIDPKEGMAGFSPHR